LFLCLLISRLNGFCSVDFFSFLNGKLVGRNTDNKIIRNQKIKAYFELTEFVMNTILNLTRWGRQLNRKLLRPKFAPKNVWETNRWNIVRGDLVEVINGPCTGQRGKVMAVLRKDNRIIVDGVNMV
jgi:transcription antitermination factor NusG